MTQELQILEKLKYDPRDEFIKVPKHTDKIILPEKILNILVNLQKAHNLSKLPHPLVFKLSTPSNNTYVGVKEFHDINEDSLYLSQDVIERLNIGNNQNSSILSIELALNVSSIEHKKDDKAIIEISPRQKYSNVTDWKSFLESTLSINYTAISKNDVLTFSLDKNDYILDVISVKTKNNLKTVCVVDRDIELVIKSFELINGDQEQEENDEIIDLFNDKSGIIKINKKFKLNLASAEMLKSDGEFLLAFDKFIGLNRFEYGSMVSSKKSWINKSNDKIEVFIYALGKEIDNDLKDSTFSVSKSDDDELINNNDDNEIDENSIRCEYCSKIISKTSQTLHENFCKRNNIKCFRCNEIFFKNIPSNHWHCCETFGTGKWNKHLHDEYIHSEITNCELCNQFQGNKYELSLHLSRECPNSIHECKYCHLNLRRGEPTNESKFYEISSHEWSCGSKTTECFKCGKIIKLFDLDMHLKLHDLDRLNQMTPRKCSNELCVNLSSENNLELCADCFSPLYSTINDPDGKKLKQRIERKYILQLKNGCEFKNCENRICRNSMNCELNNDTNMAEIVNYVKNKVMNRKEFSFCVSESMNLRRHLIDIFKGGEWQIAWICKSNLIVGNDVALMNQWLDENAIKINEVK